MIGRFRRVALTSLAGALALLTLSAVPADADAVEGPVGPELSCVNPLVPAGGTLKCRLDRFAPGTMVVVTVAGRRGALAQVRPGRDGSAELSFRWPFARIGYHTIVAEQDHGGTTLRSYTTASVSFEARMAERRRSAVERSVDRETSGRSPDDAIPAPPTRESQVPLRVSAAIGLVAVGMTVLFVRHRRRRQFGV